MAVKKIGRHPLIGEKERSQVLAAVTVGASIADAAGIIRVGLRTLRDAMAKDPAFRTGVIEARKNGKLRLIKKVTSAKPWQAAAWMLERMYGNEYGRKDTLHVKAKHDHVHRVRKDVAALAQDVDAMQAVDTYSRRLDALDLASCNGHEEKAARDLN